MEVDILLILVHILGGILCLIKNFRNGNMKCASKNGDGIRYAQPCDIVFECLVLWEFALFIECVEKIENTINSRLKKF